MICFIHHLMDDSLVGLHLNYAVWRAGMMSVEGGMLSRGWWNDECGGVE